MPSLNIELNANFRLGRKLFFKLEGIILGIGSVRNQVVLCQKIITVIMKPMNLWGQYLYCIFDYVENQRPMGLILPRKYVPQRKPHLAGLIIKTKVRSIQEGYVTN